MATGIEIMGEVLKNLGVDAETITTLKSDTVPDTIKADTIVKEVVETQRSNAENDEAFIKPLESRVRGEILNMKVPVLLKAFKDYGVTKAEYDALPEPRFDAFIALCGKKIAAHKATANPDDKDKKIEELSAALQAEQEKNEKYESEVIPSVRTELEQKLNDYKLNTSIESAYNSHLGNNLTARAEMLYPGIRKSFDDKYDVKEEGGKIVIYEKGKNTKALKDSKSISLESALEDIAKAAGVFKMSEPIPTNPHLKETGPPKPIVKPPLGQAAAEAKLKEMEEAAAGR